MQENTRNLFTFSTPNSRLAQSNKLLQMNLFRANCFHTFSLKLSDLIISYDSQLDLKANKSARFYKIIIMKLIHVV